jgi:8-oxo-dGTP pyrophosphatase MutT (NUDIX family)
VHHIQRKILAKLLYAVSLPYAAMRPEGIESNHFAYHLEQLLAAGLVSKQDRQYALTPKGLAQIDRMSHANMTGRLQPHIVTAIDITNADGQTLLFKRNFQPYIYRLGFPLGKTHFDENIAAAAARELQEKTGLTGVPLTQRGIIYIEARQQGETISKILCHVFSGTAEPGFPLPKTERGECLWADAESLKPADVMPGFIETKALLRQHHSFFFDEITAEL